MKHVKRSQFYFTIIIIIIIIITGFYFNVKEKPVPQLFPFILL